MEKINIRLHDLTEKECYELYFRLLNITRNKEMQLQQQLIDISTAMALKPMDFILDTKKSASNKSKRAELANELKMSTPAIYAPLQQLILKKVLREDDDKFIYFVPEINYFRQKIKEKIKNKETFEFNYTFDLKIKP